jgi:protoporphyrinogen IX oxidase
MNSAELYQWIKALHVASTLVFVASVIAQALFIAAMKDSSIEATRIDVVRRFYRAERRLTIPTMIVLLTTGVTLALIGNWFSSAWLIVKLVFVTALFGVHGFQSGQLRRATYGNAIASRSLQYVVLIVILIIAILAVVKP